MKTAASNRVRILQVLGGLPRGGIETWLMHVLRQIDRGRLQIDFVVQRITGGGYEEEALDLGARLFPCGRHGGLRYGHNLRRALSEQGPYDVVHSHVGHYSGYVLRVARAAGVPMRIAHSHNTWLFRKSLLRRGYERLQQHWIRRHATRGVAVSRDAADSLFGPSWRSDPNYEIMSLGLDFSPFRAAPPKSQAKADLGIPPQRQLIGHVGSFRFQKNHELLARIFRDIVASGVDAQLMLVGDGPLESDVRNQLASYGLSDRCTFAGVQRNVVPYFAAMDLFLFPSRYEGLGIVVLEAQASGVPSLISTTVPREADVMPALVQRLPLESTTQQWAAAAAQLMNDPPHQANCTQTIQQSEFGLEHCLANLSRLYTQGSSALVRLAAA